MDITTVRPSGLQPQQLLVLALKREFYHEIQQSDCQVYYYLKHTLRYLFPHPPFSVPQILNSDVKTWTEKQIRKQVARNLIILLYIWLLCGFIKHLWVFHGQPSKMLWRSQLDSPGPSCLCHCRNTHDAAGHRSYSGADFCASEITNLVPRGMQSFLLDTTPVTCSFFWWSYKHSSLNYKMLT